MEKSYVLRKHCKRLCAVVLTGFIFGLSTQVSLADSWTANSPDQIEISEGQTSYTLRRGDTLWSISQKINLSVAFLAEANGINLGLGEEYKLPVGRVISWSVNSLGQEMVTVDGAFSKVVLPSDKVVSELPVGSNLIASDFNESINSQTESLYSTFLTSSEVKQSSTKFNVVSQNSNKGQSSDLSSKGDKERLIYAFFDNETGRIKFYEGDGKRIELLSETDLNYRDPSLLKVGDTYYMAVTDVEMNKNDFSIFSTKDFKTFEKQEYYLGFSTASRQAVWAPDFFVDQTGDVHLFVSVQREGNQETTDVNGNTVRVFDTYDLIVDLVNSTVSNINKLDLDGGNKIDAHVFDFNDSYLMTVKDEVSKETELWSSSNLSAWNKVYDHIPNTPTNVEGAFVTQQDGVYRLYMDAYPEGDRVAGGMVYTETTDFKTFTEPSVLASPDPIRHGSGIVDSVSENIDNISESSSSVSISSDVASETETSSTSSISDSEVASGEVWQESYNDSGLEQSEYINQQDSIFVETIVE